jgi:hypothetical protein
MRQCVRRLPLLGDDLERAELAEVVCRAEHPFSPALRSDTWSPPRAFGAVRLIERVDTYIGIRIRHDSEEAMDATPIDGIRSQADAREGEHMNADSIEPVFSL